MAIVSSTLGSSTYDGLEPALEGGVLLDVLLVFVERRRADGAQLPARQGGLQHVGGVHRAFGSARADERVELVDEEDDRARGFLDLLQDGLQAVLELAAVLRAGDHRAEVERDDALVLETLGHVAHVTMRRARPSTIAVLPTPGSPIRTGLFFVRRERTWMTRRISSSRPMTGSILSATRQIREVAGVALQGLVLVFRIGIGDPRRAPDLLQGFQEGVLLDAGPGEPFGRVAARLGQGEQEVLGRDVLVAELLGDLERPVEHAVEVARDHGVGGGARNLGPSVELSLDLAG